jgi:hypothetical protein
MQGRVGGVSAPATSDANNADAAGLPSARSYDSILAANAAALQKVERELAENKGLMQVLSAKLNRCQRTS